MADPEDNSLLDTYKTETSDHKTGVPKIVAIGVGGGGGNVIDYMSTQDIQGVDFMAMNTDRQALDSCHANVKLLLGPKRCKGLGSGGVAQTGCEAATESVPEIEELLATDYDMVFITAGMGGGTGTGASPVIASVCMKHNLLTVGIVTIPFFFEGLDKLHSAKAGADELKKNVDALLVINNDRLGEIYADMEFTLALRKADDILATAARSISDMVTNPSVINLDMSDVRNTLYRGKTALISVGYGEGENRMSKAIQNALTSPLLCDTDISTSGHILFAFYISHDIEPKFKMEEIRQIEMLTKQINRRVKTKFGWGYDDTLGNKVKFTLLAAGFDVTVDHQGSSTIIEGNDGTTDTTEPIDDEISHLYGPDKVEEFLHHQETQNYYILSPDQLDSDVAIQQFENSPAYGRDKRKEVRQAQAKNNEINLSLDEQ